MKIKVVLLALLIALMSCLTLVSCGKTDIGTGIDEEVDVNRTQLYVSNFNGGYGDAWLKAVKERFEEANKDRVVEPGTGKVGVQVLIDNAKSVGASLLPTVLSSRNQVFFTEGVTYTDYVKQGAVLDITDMVKEPLTEYGESKSIYDKFSAEQQKYLEIDGKIYAIPHYEGYNGITIDVDLFDAKKLFLGKDGQFRYKSDQKDQLSSGPNGIAGDFDDGLPATYEEFYELCRTIKSRGCIPISWSGQYQFYVNNLVTAMAVDDSGSQEAYLNFSFNGESDYLVKSIGSDGVPVLDETVKINNNNGYEVFRQAGYYNAFSFLDTIISEGWYSEYSFTSGQSNTDAQDDFLLSNKDPAYTPIAMLVEGCWWESEATDTFRQMEQGYESAGKMDRRFRFIPFPKSATSRSTKSTLLENNTTYSFINANIDEKFKELALDFLQFCNTDQSLVEFTTITNTPKSLIYDMSESDLEKCSYFGRSVYELKANSDVVYPLTDNALFNDNVSVLFMRERIAFGDYKFPSSAFKNNEKDAKSYFEGLGEYWKNRWESVFGKYYD